MAAHLILKTCHREFFNTFVRAEILSVINSFSTKQNKYIFVGNVN